MIEKEKAPDGPPRQSEDINPNSNLATIKPIAAIGFIVFKKLLSKSRDGMITFKAWDGLETIHFNREERIEIMKALVNAGLLRFRAYYGWKVLKPDVDAPVKDVACADNSDEFGNACHGCAHFPCPESEKGEPLGDCWDYKKATDPEIETTAR